MLYLCYYNQNSLFYRYTYFISLLIPKIQSFVDSLVDKDQIAFEKGRKVYFIEFTQN